MNDCFLTAGGIENGDAKPAAVSTFERGNGVVRLLPEPFGPYPRSKNGRCAEQCSGDESSA